MMAYMYDKGKACSFRNFFYIDIAEKIMIDWWF